MWKHNFASRSSRKHTCSAFGSVIVTSCVSLPVTVHFSRCLPAGSDPSRLMLLIAEPLGGGFLLSSWLAATVSVLALADLTSHQLFNSKSQGEPLISLFSEKVCSLGSTFYFVSLHTIVITFSKDMNSHTTRQNQNYNGHLCQNTYGTNRNWYRK